MLMILENVQSSIKTILRDRQRTVYEVGQWLNDCDSS